MNNLFIELIQVSINCRPSLSRIPSLEDWLELFRQAKRQSLIGVCFLGITRIKHQHNNLPRDLYLKWLALAIQIKQQNENMNALSLAVYDKLTSDGFDCCILKGQANATFYRQELREFRQSGDVDAFVISDPETVFQYVQKQSPMRIDASYKHIHWDYFQSINVDLHYRLSASRNLIRNSKLQKWTKSVVVERDLYFDDVLKVKTLSKEYNIFFILYHIYWHFLYEGVGLRQIMDLYYILISTKDDDIITSVNNRIREFKIGKFTSAIMWILKELFMIEDKYLLLQPNEKEGRFLLSEIFLSGNMGYYDDRNISKHSKSNIVRCITKIKHYLRLVSHYPSELLWTPIGSMYFLQKQKSIDKLIDGLTRKVAN